MPCPTLGSGSLYLPEHVPKPLRELRTASFRHAADLLERQGTSVVVDAEFGFSLFVSTCTDMRSRHALSRLQSFRQTPYTRVPNVRNIRQEEGKVQSCFGVRSH